MPPTHSHVPRTVSGVPRWYGCTRYNIYIGRRRLVDVPHHLSKIDEYNAIHLSASNRRICLSSGIVWSNVVSTSLPTVFIKLHHNQHLSTHNTKAKKTTYYHVISAGIEPCCRSHHCAEPMDFLLQSKISPAESLRYPRSSAMMILMVTQLSGSAPHQPPTMIHPIQSIKCIIGRTMVNLLSFVLLPSLFLLPFDQWRQRWLFVHLHLHHRRTLRKDGKWLLGTIVNWTLSSNSHIIASLTAGQGYNHRKQYDV